MTQREPGPSHRITPAPEALSRARLDALSNDLYRLRDHLITAEHEAAGRLEAVHPDHVGSARNLIHYLSLRRYDIRPLQERLSQVGLSSLGRVEPHVMIALERTLAMLALARQAGFPDFSDGPTPIGFRQGHELLDMNSDRLLGPVGASRQVRIMVTMPSEAADNPGWIRDLMRSGMGLARINCAHDNPEIWARIVGHIHEAREELGLSCRIAMDLGGPKLRTGTLLDAEGQICEELPRLERGQYLYLVPPGAEGRPVPAPDVLLKQPGLPGEWAGGLTCSEPHVFSDVRAGEPIWFDDGTLGGMLEYASSELLAVRITQAPPGGRKLKQGKGINLPGSNLGLPALSPADYQNLPFVAQHADLVALSFVNRPADVADLLRALEELQAGSLGVILKIETYNGFRHLPELLLELMRRRDVGVMIARGDLAVESGFVRLAEVQEEILRITEAAHVPVIWATQVLENLAKTGLPSRAEVTDAAMSVRAEAVMLNKGPYILEAVQALETILISMQPHITKKRTWLPALKR
jgi:pyruvate kinase